MILFIDDEARRLLPYIQDIEATGLDVTVLTSLLEVRTFLSDFRGDHPQCIVLDVMFPGDPGLPLEFTRQGIVSGMPLFGILRAHFPGTTVVIFTSAGDPAILSYFETMPRCLVCQKADMFPHELTGLIVGLCSDKGPALTTRLEACICGREGAEDYEAVSLDILQYLFVPPLGEAIPQSATNDGRLRRDAIIPNEGLSFFWTSVRQQFDARYIVVEFKNYCGEVGKNEVLQLRDYLSQKSLGRFGVLVSRIEPGIPALDAARRAYGAAESVLILFLTDNLMKEMIELRNEGRDPAFVLQRLKQQFEIGFSG